MNTKQQLIALYTLVRREFARMFRIFSQVFLPPVITTLLYFLIFGTIIGVILEKSGAALTMAETIIRLLGQRFPTLTMSLIGYLVSIPVFCDSGYVILNSLKNAVAARMNVSVTAMSVALATGLFVVYSVLSFLMVQRRRTFGLLRALGMTHGRLARLLIGEVLVIAAFGALAGLVGITAGCSVVSPGASIFIGVAAGVLSVFGVVWLDKLQIDDPVGAFPVHGLCGVWGTLAVGLFGQKAFGANFDGLFYGGGPEALGRQLVGILACLGFVVVSMGIVFKAIDSIIGLRVSEETELRGLDVGEHGMESYAGFQIFVTE